MNDRYLYRAKRMDNGEWVEGYYAKRHGVPMIYENRDCPQSIYEIDPSTICQCTGLKDKNGKLIWENDIIKCKCGMAIVVWDMSEWMVKWVNDTICRKDLRFWVNEFELGVDIIGSAIDNPGMLWVGE